MACNICGHDAGTVPAARPGAPDHRYCERCGTLLPAGASARLFLDTLALLGRFGLATHTRLLLGTSREDG